MAIANGQVLTAEDFLPYNISTWQAYTPTWTGLTLGNGVTAGQWCRIGNSVFVRIQLTWGSTTAFTSGYIYPSMPVTPTSPTLEMLPGYLFRFSPTNFLTTVLVPGAYLVISSGGRVIAANPWAWAVSDQIRIAGSYQANV